NCFITSRSICTIDGGWLARTGRSGAAGATCPAGGLEGRDRLGRGFRDEGTACAGGGEAAMRSLRPRRARMLGTILMTAPPRRRLRMLAFGQAPAESSECSRTVRSESGAAAGVGD